MEENLVLLIPIVIIEFALLIAALVHILKHDTYKIGTKGLWIVIVVFIQIIGPIAYFIFGRGDE